jgi:hypothetical protein
MNVIFSNIYRKEVEELRHLVDQLENNTDIHQQLLDQFISPIKAPPPTTSIAVSRWLFSGFYNLFTISILFITGLIVFFLHHSYNSWSDNMAPIDILIPQ